MQSISAPIVVSVNGGNGFKDRPRNETTIAVDPTNPSLLIAGANDYIVGDSSCGSYISRDAGATWEASLLPGHEYLLGATLPTPVNVNPQTTPQRVHSRLDLSGDPAIDFDGQGNAFYMCLGANRPENDGSIYVSTALRGTYSFNRPVLIDSGFTPVVFNDKPSIVADKSAGKPNSGKVYAFWTKFIGLNVTILETSVSTDHGRTFSTPQIISTINQASASGTAAGIGPGGEVYVAYENDTTNPCSYQPCQTTLNLPSELDFQKSTDGGVTYSAPAKLADDTPSAGQIQHTVGRDNSFPTMVVDSSPQSRYSGRVYVAWTDNKDLHADIRLTYSENGGKSWSPPRKLNDDNPNPGADHVFPGLAVAPDGLVVADWPVDQRDDPVGGHFRAYFTESHNGGQTWERNLPLSPLLYNQNDTDFAGAFIGDYNAIAADNFAVHPIWVGMREDDPKAPDASRHEVVYTNLMPRVNAVATQAPAAPAALPAAAAAAAGNLPNTSSSSALTIALALLVGALLGWRVRRPRSA